ncbi:MAG: DMT family transporter [Anaerolineales bacterium]|nr:DMT family transporter [Anaerolineales bacterium]
MPSSPTPRFPPTAVLFVGVLAISSSSILIRIVQDQAVPSLVIAAWRLTLATAVLLPLTLTTRRTELAALSPPAWRLALLSGLLLAVHFASYVSALAYTSVASATVLATSSPLWVGLASPLLLHEALSRHLRLGIALALLGSVFIGLADVVAVVDGRFLFSLTRFTAQPNPLLGNGLALLAALTAAGYLIIGRRLRPSLSLLGYTTLVYGSAALCLLMFALAARLPLFGYPPLAYLLMLLMALFPQLIGHSSYNWALGYLPAAYVSVAVISEPIGASLLALLLFAELPNHLTLLGSALLLAGILVASRRT